MTAEAEQFDGRELTTLNTLALSARARYYCRVEDRDSLRAALAFASGRQLSVLPLGEGSNVVLGGQFDGLVLHLATAGIEVQHQDADDVYVRVAAGENWHRLVEQCLQRGWYGLENLALIPGLAGAAPIQNIGAYGVELSAFCTAVETIDIASGEPRTLDADACEFGYRDSIFKHALRDQVIVTALQLRLSRHARANIAYQALAETLIGGAATATPQAVYQAVCRLRRARLPDPAQIPNVGSFFKNPVISAAVYRQLLTRHPGLVAWPQGPDFKLAAAWLLDEDGWRGYSDGVVGMHQQQALVLVNRGGANAAQVLALAMRIRDRIRDRFGVELEIEPRVYCDA